MFLVCSLYQFASARIASKCCVPAQGGWYVFLGNHGIRTCLVAAVGQPSSMFYSWRLTLFASKHSTPAEGAQDVFVGEWCAPTCLVVGDCETPLCLGAMRLLFQAVQRPSCLPVRPKMLPGKSCRNVVQCCIKQPTGNVGDNNIYRYIDIVKHFYPRHLFLINFTSSNVYGQYCLPLWFISCSTETFHSTETFQSAQRCYLTSYWLT